LHGALVVACLERGDVGGLLDLSHVHDGPLDADRLRALELPAEDRPHHRVARAHPGVERRGEGEGRGEEDEEDHPDHLLVLLDGEPETVPGVDLFLRHGRSALSGPTSAGRRFKRRGFGVRTGPRTGTSRGMKVTILWSGTRIAIGALPGRSRRRKPVQKLKITCARMPWTSFRSGFTKRKSWS